MRLVVVLALFFCSLNLWADSGKKKVTIVASIRPLTLIAQDVVGDLAEVKTLVPSGASHHDYAMRVSDRRRLEAAQLVIWMGPSMERFLEKPLVNLGPRRVLALGQEWEADQHHDHSHDHQHDHADHVDLHQWLDPRLASQMAQQIAERLQELMPQHAALLASRGQEVAARYIALHKKIEEVLEPVRSVGFVVEHRGYDLLVEAYDLRQLAWISEHPEQSPSVRHLYQLEQSIRSQPEAEQARCLFNERSHSSPGAANLARQLGLTLRSLDILGDEADTYAALMQNLASDMANCLSGAAP